MTFYTKFIPHNQVQAYQALGWRLAGNGSGLGAHAHWSALMRWDGEGNPPEPAIPLPPSNLKLEECAKPT